jgi:hypothetical protein
MRDSSACSQRGALAEERRRAVLDPRLHFVHLVYDGLHVRIVRRPALQERLALPVQFLEAVQVRRRHLEELRGRHGAPQEFLGVVVLLERQERPSHRITLERDRNHIRPDQVQF